MRYFSFSFTDNTTCVQGLSEWTLLPRVVPILSRHERRTVDGANWAKHSVANVQQRASDVRHGSHRCTWGDEEPAIALDESYDEFAKWFRRCPGWI